MALVFYGYPKCGTCRSAHKWLKDHDVPHTYIDITRDPPSEAQLGGMVRQSGLDVRKFFNTSGQVYRELALKDRLPGMTQEEMLKLLAGNGMLIKRPLVTDGSRTTVGFSQEEYRQVWL